MITDNEQNEMPEVHTGNENSTPTASTNKKSNPIFANDLSEETAHKVEERIVNHVRELLKCPELTSIDVAWLGMCSNATVKTRAEHSDSANKILINIINGVASERTKPVNKNSVLTFINNMSEEERAIFLAGLSK